jgi:hypothetical protein
MALIVCEFLLKVLYPDNASLTKTDGYFSDGEFLPPLSGCDFN